MINVLILITSIFLGSGRSVFSKMIPTSKGKSEFFSNQAILFLAASLAIFIFNPKAFAEITCLTFIFAAAFGILTIAAQWCYTVALGKGPTSICAMIYSFGFIFPTIIGSLFWTEPFGFTTFIGLAVTILAIIASSFTDKNNGTKNKGFLIPNLIAMAASGGLGILQKVHQSSQDAKNIDAFLIIAFALSMFASLFMAVISTKSDNNDKKFSIYPILAGICFGTVSLTNTLLAGRMKSAILFPSLNIGVMMMCLILGIIIFKEKPTKPQIFAFFLGILAILILSI